MRSSLMVVFVLAAGCGGGTTTQEEGTAQEALDSNEVGSAESAIMVTSADSAEGSTGEAAATSAKTKFPAHFTPSGCAVATVTGNKVSYVLTKCTGPWGLAHVTGTIDVTYTKTATGFSAVASGSNLMVNRATIDLDATGTFSSDGTTKTATVDAKSSGTGPNGNHVTRSGSYTVTWDSTCMTLDGMWTTGIGLKSASTTIDNMKLCSGMCPQSGTVVHVGFFGFTITVSFDGTGAVKWSTSNNKSGTVNLSCDA